MGTVLKVFGILFIGFWLMVGVGCTMLMRGMSHSGYKGSGSSYSSSNSRDRDDVVRAMRDGRVEVGRLPDDIRTAPEVTVTLRDGSTRVLGNTLADRILREALADQSRAAQEHDVQSYDRPYVQQPHFKPGEPMVNPNPSSSYDD